MKLERLKNLSGDFWGGLAAMLVALPSAIAFGVTIYSPLGSSFAAYGALAGILGVAALGLVAPVIGGTNRLISAPCAPAAAVLSAFAVNSIAQGISPEMILLMLALLGLIAGVIQVVFGSIGLGRLIKYMPYPVVSGYLSGVGLYIIASQVPKLLGVPKDIHFWESLLAYSQWRWQGIVVGAVSIIVMLLATRVTRMIPAAILSLAFGVGAYFGLGMLDNSMLSLSGNTLVVGELGGIGEGGFVAAVSDRWQAVSGLNLQVVEGLLMTALTLAILLSIDTLKTCVVLDALTRSRHNSNRELIGQGCGNIVSSIISGMPGAGTMGATLVNMSSGAVTRVSGIIEGVLAIIAFLVLGQYIAWVPVASLSGILIVIGFNMMERDTLNFLRYRSTILDFAVITAVVIVALTVSLIAASAVGVVLAIFLFIREQIGDKIVHRKSYGNEVFSKQIRVEKEMQVLTQHGDQTVIFELQGSLFFGTTDQLYTSLEPDLKKRKYIILDMHRVHSVDITATHMLEQIKDTLAERDGMLIFCSIPEALPSGKDMHQYFGHVGLLEEQDQIMVFPELGDALEWSENQILKQASLEHDEVELLDLHEIELFRGRREETIGALEASMEERFYKAGEQIFAAGDSDADLFLIRRGQVRILLPLGSGHSHHVSTFGKGAFFGEMSFLDKGTRSAGAIAFTDTDLFVLSREKFNDLSDSHKKFAINLLGGLARVLSDRLRYTNVENRRLSE